MSPTYVVCTKPSANQGPCNQIFCGGPKIILIAQCPKQRIRDHIFSLIVVGASELTDRHEPTRSSAFSLLPIVGSLPPPFPSPVGTHRVFLAGSEVPWIFCRTVKVRHRNSHVTLLWLQLPRPPRTALRPELSWVTSAARPRRTLCLCCRFPWTESIESSASSVRCAPLKLLHHRHRRPPPTTTQAPSLAMLRPQTQTRAPRQTARPTILLVARFLPQRSRRTTNPGLPLARTTRLSAKVCRSPSHPAHRPFPVAVTLTLCLIKVFQQPQCHLPPLHQLCQGSP